MILNFVKKHPLILSIVCIIIILLGIICIPFFREKQNYFLTIHTKGVILPFLFLQVSPPGYPQIGQSWKINVYIVNRTVDHKPLYETASNASVIVTVLSEGRETVYQLHTDDKGEALFQFRPEYESIAFQAYYSGILSEKIILTTSYVSVDIVNTLLIYNIFSVIGSIASSLFYKPKKSPPLAIINSLTKLIFVCVLCIFSFITLICIYAKIFLSTAWGYPENLMNGYITFTLLRYVFYVGIILFLAHWILKIVIKGMETK